MSVRTTVGYLAAGANRQTAASDWGIDGTLCYGAGVNLAVWWPSQPDGGHDDGYDGGVVHLLGGHDDVVKAVHFLALDEVASEAYVVSGGDDHVLKLWAIPTTAPGAGAGAGAGARCVQTVENAHAAPINCIVAVRPPAQAPSTSKDTATRHCLFATGGADYAIKIWAVERLDAYSDVHSDAAAAAAYHIVLLQTLPTTVPCYFPLCLALAPLPGHDAWLLAAAGTSNRIQVFVGIDGADGTTTFALQATLAGHEDWVRSLDFAWEAGAGAGDLLLASASQDKYVRLWRVHEGADKATPTSQTSTATADPLGDFFAGGQRGPTNKKHLLRVARASAEGNSDGNTRAADPLVTDYTVTFEALLLGHEDWVYSARWEARNSDNADGHGSDRRRLRLLTASADNSLAIWEADTGSGIWVTTARLGELSKEKGATSATGSVGGFWTGLWAPSSSSIPDASVATLCRTGSWRRWAWDAARGRWMQAVGISGHVAPVTGVAWARSGQYLLSTSGDQTTRLHAEWRRAQAATSWHEMARPQIHGYDLNCIDTLGRAEFVSGADEKLMRVFREPKTVARLLAQLTDDGGARHDGAGVEPDVDIDALPDAANMPVLGLSNKAIDEDDAEADSSEVLQASTTDDDTTDAAATHPPFEDVLARSTLWPETEKLYGHGYEISCLAVSHDGALVASACRASSLNHAVLRLFETTHWTEVRPPLAAHTLTVTRLRFSRDDRRLLSVGRDRQWVVYVRQAPASASQQEQGHENGQLQQPGDGVVPALPSTACHYTLQQANAKAHTRMLLDCAWAPAVPGARVFATAGRDKNVKVWSSFTIAAAAAEVTSKAATEVRETFTLAATLPQEHPVTAIDFLWRLSSSWPQQLVLAVGTEGGRLLVVRLDVTSLAVASTLAFDQALCLPRAVLQLAWRPGPDAEDDQETAAAVDSVDLAVAGEDASLRVYRVEV